MAIKEVQMPNLGESVTEAAVSQWLVQPGDHVKRYDPLMEVVSDKVTTEVPSDFDGVVKELVIELDTDVPIGTVVMTLEIEGGADGSTTAAEGKTESVEATTGSEGIPTGTTAPQASGSEKSTATPAKETTGSGTIAQAAKPDKSVKPAGKNTGRYSPAVLKLAQEKGIDLAEVTGTGNEGRITRKDILNFTPGQAVASEMPTADNAASATVTESVTTPTETSRTIEAHAEKSVSSSVKNTATPTSNGKDIVVPADGVRKAIAKKMVQSATEIPHAWMMVEADVSNIVALRNKVKGDFKQQEGMSLSYFPFFAKAVVQALKKNPKINTSWKDGSIIYHNDINLSIAVTTDDHLYVPVIHQADNYSLAGLAKEIQRLASEVRGGTLANADMQGGTFTINNTGSLGSIQSMGIINYPQAAILQVESINKRMVPTADGGFKVADMVNLCLSIDHRILDGQQGGKFLNDIKENLARFSNESDIY
ncbi:dihydrolipoamide succinyltransferase [Enterococcus sp. JM4C]|uniref:dihydrolipoamide acetyltransferase family protein n=1 Tax=Candidatus Enterococcus huntleyi TaxID=1857217 RepID=UPI00137A0B2B|nr:dihydrolipoamide acetyltransferase family protein [Enterococcus sp. JM4C]KAF1299450.1 dihydrolipoamide succinyltransferase [Enterococcus sp. JM4C]